MSWWQEIRLTPFNRLFAVTLLVVMSVQLVPIEGYEISPVKLLMMGLCVVVFVCKVPYISNALIFAILYWFVCFATSILQLGFRFSTLAYSGLFLMAFVTYHNIVYAGTFSLKQFQKVLRTIIIAYAVVLVAQQVCVLLGLRNVPFLNLVGAGYYQWNRLPVLACEPSHSATILTGLFIGYLRCVELQNILRLMNAVKTKSCRN